MPIQFSKIYIEPTGLFDISQITEAINIACPDLPTDISDLITQFTSFPTVTIESSKLHFCNDCWSFGNVLRFFHLEVDLWTKIYHFIDEQTQQHYLMLCLGSVPTFNQHYLDVSRNYQALSFTFAYLQKIKQQFHLWYAPLAYLFDIVLLTRETTSYGLHHQWILAGYVIPQHNVAQLSQQLSGLYQKISTRDYCRPPSIGELQHITRLFYHKPFWYDIRPETTEIIQQYFNGAQPFNNPRSSELLTKQPWWQGKNSHLGQCKICKDLAWRHYCQSCLLVVCNKCTVDYLIEQQTFHVCRRCLRLYENPVIIHYPSCELLARELLDILFLSVKT